MIKTEKRLLSSLTDEEQSAMIELLSPHYIDPLPQFTNSIRDNNTVYITKFDERILAFFMVNWEDVSAGGNLVYLGLSCVDATLKNASLGKSVYLQFILDAAELEFEKGIELHCYATTASPIVLLAVQKLWRDVLPSIDGSYTLIGEKLIEQIKYQKGLSIYSTPTHPFILKGISTKVLYSPEQLEYIQQVARQKNIDVFERLGIDEEQGDRMLLLLFIPKDDHLFRLKTEFLHIINAVYEFNH